jgi:hypothetical protein
MTTITHADAIAAIRAAGLDGLLAQARWACEDGAWGDIVERGRYE